MYYLDQGNGYTPKQIQNADQNGGLYELTYVGPTYMNSTCYSPQHWPLHCPTLVIEDGVSVTFDTSFNVSIYPNPFEESINIHVDISEAAFIKVKMFDMLGQVVETQNYGMQLGSIEDSIDVSSLNVGMYIMTVSVGERTIQIKLIKK